MKVCTCLNPLHTCLAIFGCLLGYRKISDEMKDRELVKLVETVGYKEGLPVVVDPIILSPKEFIDTVLKVRVPNPFMPDTPQRIATDTSQKLAVRFGETKDKRNHLQIINFQVFVRRISLNSLPEPDRQFLGSIRCNPLWCVRHKGISGH